MLRSRPKLRISLIVLAILLVLLSPFILHTLKVMGKNPSGERLSRIEQSGHYADDSFQNLAPTPVTLPDISMVKLLTKFFSPNPGVTPPKKIPSVKTDLKTLKGETPTVVWFGHSSYMLRHNNFTLLVDPMFSSYASPIPGLVKAFDGTEVYHPKDFPHLNAVIISHDHYDHLDYQTIVDLAPTTDRFVVPLGIGAHLESWGIDPEKITELNWDESADFAGDVRLTTVPARHFSGRGFTRGKTFWNAYVLSLPGYKIYLGGEGGYGDHIKANGEKWGPFDLAILENGQYDVNWPYIHMFPEQTAQSAKDLGAKVLLPVHWSKFPLANHEWNEPVKRLLKAADELGVKVITPMIGEPYRVGDEVTVNKWWGL